MEQKAEHLREGWYLMTPRDVELELLRLSGSENAVTNSKPLSIEEALTYKAAGNVPDDFGRTLRLILHVSSQEELRSLDAKRLQFEPDYMEEPTWKRPGSKPINVVPLRSAHVSGPAAGPWWQRPDLKALEDEWRRSGRIGGIAIPGEYRGFIYKTVLSLRATGRDVTVDAILDSIARWLGPRDLALLRTSLESLNG